MGQVNLCVETINRYGVYNTPYIRTCTSTSTTFGLSVFCTWGILLHSYLLVDLGGLDYYY